MDFALSQEQLQLQQAARRFCRQELPALANELERSDEPLPAGWLRRYGELGFLGINSECRYGGLGLSNLDAGIVLEEFAKVSVGVAFPVFEATTGPVRIVEAFGSESLRERVVPRVVRGEASVALSMSEPEAGTAVTDLTTRAREVGDEIVLNGTKRWCSGAGHAEGYVVFCRMSEAPGARGIGAVYVERGTPGFTFGRRERLMGFRGVGSADMIFEDCRVPRDNLLRGAGGFAVLMELFNLERCGNATMALGVAAGALEQVTGYLQERRQFGKPLIEFQAAQIRLAEIAIGVEAARLLVQRALAGPARYPAAQEAAIAKCFANEMVRSATGLAVQLMGGYGYAADYGMERRLRDAWGWGIAGGTIDIQKVNIAAGLVGRRFDQRR